MKSLKKCLGLFCVFLLFSHGLFAAETKNLKKMAEQELTPSAATVPNKAVGDQIATVKVSMPPQEVERGQLWDISVFAQNYESQGTVVMDHNGSYSLNNLGTKPMVGMDFRWWGLPWQNERYETGIGVQVGAAYNRIDLQLSNGVVEHDTQLNTFLVALGPSFEFIPIPSLARVHLELDAGLGDLSLTQSSLSTNLNTRSDVLFYTLGSNLKWYFLKNAYAKIAFDYRQKIQQNNLGLQNSNALVGLGVRL